MRSPLEIDIWKRQGHTILWDAASLMSFCKPEQAISLRRFLQLHKQNWKNIDNLLVRERALVVSGIEGTLDVLEPNDAVEWMEQHVYPAVVSFQKQVAYGGGEAALIFWFTDRRRFDYRVAEQAAYWECSKAHGKHDIPLGRCLWNGSEPNGQEIQVKVEKQPTTTAGYFLQRIS